MLHVHVKFGFDLSRYVREALAVGVSRLEILKSFSNIREMFVHTCNCKHVHILLCLQNHNSRNK